LHISSILLVFSALAEKFYGIDFLQIKKRFAIDAKVDQRNDAASPV